MMNMMNMMNMINSEHCEGCIEYTKKNTLFLLHLQILLIISVFYNYV